MAETRYILKILSGLHTGAEFCLPPGVTRLGRSAACDLILHDQGLDDEHFIFRCSAQQALVECPTRASAALLEGMEPLQNGGSYTIRDYGLLSSAGLYLALGRADADWDVPTPERLFLQFVNAEQPRQAPQDDTDGAEDSPLEVEEAPRAEEPEMAGDVAEDTGGDTDDGSGSGRAEDIGVEEGIEQMAAGADNGPDHDAGGAREDDADDEPGLPGTADAGAVSDAAPDHLAPGHARRRAWYAGAGALAVAALCATLFYYWQGQAQRADAGAAPALSQADVEAIAADFNMEASYDLRDGRVLHVQGHVLNNDEKQEFIRAMYARGIIVRPRLVVVEDFKNNILNILEQLVHPARHESISVSVKADDITTLILQGYVQDAGQWQETLDETMRQVDVVAYEDQVTHWDDGYRRLLQLLEEHGLDGALRLEQDRQNDRVILFAKSRDQGHEQRLEALALAYRQDYSRPALLLSGPGEEAAMPRFTASTILGASFNVLNYLLLDDGHRYFVGSLTPGGYRLDELNESFAIFSLDDTDYVYYFDEPDPPR